jgi:hypothetical protein
MGYQSDVLTSHSARSITREFPGHVPFEVVTSRVRQIQVTWESAVIDCLLRVYNSMYDVLKDCIATTFSQYPMYQDTLRQV